MTRWLVKLPKRFVYVVTDYDDFAEDPAFRKFCKNWEQAWEFTPHDEMDTISEMIRSVYGSSFDKQLLETGIHMWTYIRHYLETSTIHEHPTLFELKLQYLGDRTDIVACWLRTVHGCALCSIFCDACGKCPLMKCTLIGSQFSRIVHYLGFSCNGGQKDAIDACDEIIEAHEELLEQIKED